MLNLYLYKTDFGLEANWTFFATSHGKSHCDGIGRIVKRLTACASLQRQHSSQILTVASMLEFCQENIKDIKFCYLPKNKLQAVREELKNRKIEGANHSRNKVLPFFCSTK